MSPNDVTTTTNGWGGTHRGPITREDLEGKLREITGEVTEKVETARSIGAAVAVGAAVVFVIGAYWFGRRSGKKRRTVLEIRRI